MEEKKKKFEKEKKPRCPFGDLDCEDCRLYIGHLGGGTVRACAFILTAEK